MIAEEGNMRLRKDVLGAAVLATILWSISIAEAQDAVVSFGVAPSGPLGP